MICSCECLPDGVLESREAGRDVRTEMDAQEPSPALRQHLEVAARCRRLDDAESVFLPRDRQIVGLVAGDLQKNAGVRAALVGLSGRVQEARSESQAGGYPLVIADH